VRKTTIGVTLVGMLDPNICMVEGVDNGYFCGSHHWTWFLECPHAWALPIANQMSQFFPSSENHSFGKCYIPSNKSIESVDGYEIECT
jgi:hypothetical protein